MRVNGKNWLLLTNDYVWGHTTSKATRAIIEANGGKVVDELLVPQNTRDFAAYLLKIQQIKPDVVATAVGGDDIKALRQQVVQSEDEQEARPGSTTSRTGPTSTASARTRSSACSAPTGTGGSTCRASRSSSPPTRSSTRASRSSTPGNVYYNGYMATRELLKRGGARRHDQQPGGDPGAGEPEGLGAATACSTSTPT